MSTELRRHRVDLASTMACWIDSLRPPRVHLVLGPDHALSRSAELAHTLTLQAIATAAATGAGAVAVAERRAWGATLLIAAVLAELTVLAVLAIARQVQREAVLRVIAEGEETLPLNAVARQARRLASPRYRAELTCRLLRALADARRWHQIAVASRPPEGVKILKRYAREIDEIVETLHGRQPALCGVAALELFLIGGYGGALYTGDAVELQQQLWRIRYLLNPGPGPSTSHGNRD